MVKKENSMTRSSIQKAPFIELEPNGYASVLNYNLPQSTCYNVILGIVLDLPESIFGQVTPPEDNFWLREEKQTREEWIINLRDEMQFASKESIFTNQYVLLKEGIIQAERDRKLLVKLQILKEAEQLNSIGNNQKKAELYKKVFGDCCDVPQVGCSCGCGGDCNCNESKSTTSSDNE